MSKASWAFKKTDFRRVIEAAQAAGVNKFSVDVDRNGTISLTVGESPVVQPVRDIADAVRREREEDRRARRLG